jgi:hypothetical protein
MRARMMALFPMPMFSARTPPPFKTKERERERKREK